jgi:hypothetical protein
MSLCSYILAFDYECTEIIKGFIGRVKGFCMKLYKKTAKSILRSKYIIFYLK